MKSFFYGLVPVSLYPDEWSVHLLLALFLSLTVRLTRIMLHHLLIRLFAAISANVLRLALVLLLLDLVMGLHFPSYAIVGLDH